VLELIVVFVNPLVLRVKPFITRFEIVFLDRLINFFNLLILEFAFFHFLLFFLKLEVECIYHFLFKMLSFLLVLFVGLNSYIKMISSIVIIDS
jgi:hypothetical protein